MKQKTWDLHTLDFSFFSEERIIGKGGFGTVFAVRKKFGNKEENLVSKMDIDNVYRLVYGPWLRDISELLFVDVNTNIYIYIL